MTIQSEDGKDTRFLKPLSTEPDINQGCCLGKQTFKRIVLSGIDLFVAVI